MKKMTAKEAREIKIPDDIKEHNKMSMEEMEKEIFDFENSYIWPLWPILPVKNVMWRHVDSRLPWSAVIVAIGDNDGKIEKRVYLIGPFDLKEHGITTTRDIRDKVEFLEYATWGEMIEAGWRVD
jgi:hypothetical protein